MQQFLVVVIFCSHLSVSAGNQNDTGIQNGTTVQTSPTPTESSHEHYSGHSPEQTGTTELTTTEPPECEPETLTSTNGSFTSPGYPKRYRKNLNCVWKIAAPKGSTIELVISEIDIEPQRLCSFDALEIYDGPDINSSKVAMICHRGRNVTTIVSASNHLTALFRSDNDIGGDGFVANYKVISCVIKTLMKGGDLKWFKFSDDPKTKGSNLKKALLGNKGTYSGLDKKSVTFNIQGKGKFTVKEVRISTKFASKVEFIFHIKKKGKNSTEKITKRVKKSSKWSSFTERSNKKIIKLSITAMWDSKQKTKTKVSVKDLKVEACSE